MKFLLAEVFLLRSDLMNAIERSLRRLSLWETWTAWTRRVLACPFMHAESVFADCDVLGLRCVQSLLPVDDYESTVTIDDYDFESIDEEEEEEAAPVVATAEGNSFERYLEAYRNYQSFLQDAQQRINSIPQEHGSENILHPAQFWWRQHPAREWTDDDFHDSTGVWDWSDWSHLATDEYDESSTGAARPTGWRYD